MDVSTALNLRCECQDGCVHSSESVKMDVCIALGLRCQCQDGCAHSSGFALSVSRSRMFA